MDKKVYTIHSGDSLTIIIGTKTYQISGEREVTQALALMNQADYKLDDLLGLLNPSQDLETRSGGELVVDNEQILWRGEPLNHTCVSRIIELKRSGYDFSSVLNFLRKLLNNCSKQSVDELYDWLNHKGLPLTPEGDVIGYKAIRFNYTDIYTRTFDNHPGQKHSMPRNQVDDNRNNSCSKGFHCGSWEYAKSLRLSNGRIVLVKFNPADAVSVPIDHEAQKLRVSAYEVLSEYEYDDIIKEPVYNPNSDYDEFDDELEDDNDWDDEDDDSLCSSCSYKLIGDEYFCPKCGERVRD